MRPTFHLTAVAAAIFAAVPVSAVPVVGAFERFFANAADEQGLIDGGVLLLNELNCVACHAAPAGWTERLPGRGKISLAGVSGRLDADTIRAFVRDPQNFKPGTTMPSLVGGDAAMAEGIAAYLATLTPAADEPAARPYPTGDGARGQRLYSAIGCVSCHAPTEGRSGFASVPIELARHMPAATLAAFLQDPLHTRPAARMPAFALGDAEAADLAAFLQRDARGASAARLEPKRAGPDGRATFKAMNCVACHDGGETAVAARAKPLADVQPRRGCLSAQAVAGVPAFSLSERQAGAIAAAIQAMKSASPAPAPAQRVAETMAQLNCYACHEWRGSGGVEEARAQSLATLDSGAESLGELGRLPPKLDNAGRKLTAAWLEKILAGNGGGVRPYLSARMPRFGAAHAAVLVPLLEEACRPERPLAIDTSGSKGHQRAATGRLLIGTGEAGLGCVACHGLKDREPPGVRSINLTHTAQRIRPEYFKALLLDPQKIQPGTIMPPLFTARKAAEKEIESVWTYLKELDQNPRLPDGLIAADSFELKPENENAPIVFRTFLEGAGTHAIAVGYPSRAHVAFDAFEVRWAIAWRGRFLDALSNWEERTMPPIKPLGTEMRTFANTMPLARLRDAGDPWPVAYGPAAGYVFEGYRLGPDRTPTFRYRIGDLEVEDTLRPDGEGRVLRHVVRVRGSEPGWFFRGLAPGASPQPVTWREGVAVFEETLPF